MATISTTTELVQALNGSAYNVEKQKTTYLIAHDGGSFCFDCAVRERSRLAAEIIERQTNPHPDDCWLVVGVQVNYSNNALSCDHCNKPVCSMYPETVRAWDRRGAIPDFLRGYVTCSLWISTDGSDPETGGDPMDDNYNFDDIAPSAWQAMTDDCASFQGRMQSVLDQVVGNDYSEQRAGHDYWLTRNHHGAGFWDRDLGTPGDQLTRCADSDGSRDLYIRDDNAVYQMGSENDAIDAPWREERKDD
jgi:hypothetical protein